MSSHTWLALVALAEPKMPNAHAIQASLLASAPGEPPPQLSSETDHMATFAWGESVVAYTLVDRPVPDGQLEGPAARAWYWPEAREQLSRHQAHLLVAVVPPEGDRLDAGIWLARFVAALLPAAQGALGVQWGGSRAVHEPTAFRQVASKMSRDDLPLHLWIDFQVEQHESGGLRLYTTGLEAFGQREIEAADFPGAPQDLVNHAYNFAHYLLEKHPKIEDGQQVGLPDDVQVTVRETTTFLDGDMPVYRFEFE